MVCLRSWSLSAPAALLLVFAPALRADAPALRDQISLNGNWPQGGAVPRYDSQNVSFDSKTYERSFTVPSAWAGKRVKVEFNAVNWYCDVSVDGQKVGSHNGAWIPFALDITDRVRAGQTHTLRLDVRGELQPPTQEGGKILWWIGYNDLDRKRAGIVDDVWLRAYGPVHIEDAFIRTSCRNRQVRVDYTVVNRSSNRWTGRVVGDAVPASGGNPAKTLQTADFSLDPGQRTTVSATASWTDPSLWWPDRPNLYLLQSRLVASGGQVVDRETRRFGFREIWIEGNQFRLNGIRVNFRGDWSCFSQYWGSIPDRDTLRYHYQEMLKTHANILRWHKHPAPKFAYEMADEMGIPIIAESALYGRPYYNHDQKTRLIDNCLTLIPSWVKGLRNHPSILIWSACNEASYPSLSNIPVDQLKRLGDRICEIDDTRPVNYDGDASVPGVMVNRHYPEGYEKNPTDKYPNGDMYNDWISLNSPTRPTYLGEILAVRPGENDNAWWIGVWPRGLRHANFAGIAPRVYYAGTRITPAQAELQAKAYAPIALFDIAYDKLGIRPYKDGVLPSLDEGATLRRSLVVYNDDYRDTSVTLEIELLVGGTSCAKGRATVPVTLGEHLDFEAAFQVPFKGGSILEVAYRTFKGGTLRFEEKKKFAIRELGKSGTSSPSVTFYGLPSVPPPNQPPSVSFATPVDGASFDAGTNLYVKVNASDPDGTVSNVKLYFDGQLVRQENTAPYEWGAPGQNDSLLQNLAPGTHTLKAVATDNSGATTASSITLTVRASLPAPWQAKDVGGAAPGSPTYSNGTFMIEGSGADVWGTADAFRFVWRTLQGDGQIVARVVSIEATHDWAKAGVMFRETLDAGSRHAMMVVTPSRGVSFQRRVASGGTSASTTVSGLKAPCWVKVVRRGDALSGYHSADGLHWTWVGTAVIPMAATVYVGLVVTSHDAGALCTAVFDSVEVAAAPPPAEELVRVVSVSTNRPYSLAEAKGGALPYIDRSYTVNSLGPALAGGVLVRTAMEDKYGTAEAHLVLWLSREGEVYVGYDTRGTLPGWLGGWIPTSEAFVTADGAASPMRVYRKGFGAGSVVLGGNRASPASGARANYVVVVKPAGLGKMTSAGVVYEEGPIPADRWQSEGDGDGDGLRDGFEGLVGTNPGAADTDDDGEPDESEVLADGRTLWEAQEGLPAGGIPEGGKDGEGRCGAMGIEAVLLLILLPRISGISRGTPRRSASDPLPRAGDCRSGPSRSDLGTWRAR